MYHSHNKGKLNQIDIDDAKQFNKMFIELKNLYNGHATSNSNYSKKIGFDLYVRNFYNLLILDELIDGEYCDINILRNKLSHKLPKQFDNRYSIEVAIYALDLCRRQIIEHKEDENNARVLLKITKKGIDAYNDNTFHDLASTSFYGYQSFILSRNSLIIAIVAILISVITISLSLFKDQTISINDSQLKSIKLELKNIEQKIDKH